MTTGGQPSVPTVQFAGGERPSRITTGIDFEADGKQHDYLCVPHSRNDSAWGFIQVPITVVKNGNGPTIFLSGACHGDEYEGPIGLMKLARAVEARDVQGRLIIVPALNMAAVRQATRLSPIDGANLNRIYPGRRDGSVSEMLADYVLNQLVHRADVVVDFHSGGRSLDFHPCAVMHYLDDQAAFDRTLKAVTAFGAPVALVLRELDDEGMLDTAVEAMGKCFISTELGGGGRVTVRSMQVADRGINNLLVHFGVLSAPLAYAAGIADEATRVMTTPHKDCFTIAEHAGMYEIIAALGSAVRAGDPVGRIHPYEEPGGTAIPYYARRDGLILSRHAPGLVQKGDCLAVVAVDLARESP